jgi:hypothetical protein
VDTADEGDDFDPTKHLCIYCNRQFTFARALRRHIDYCAVRRDLVECNEYIDDDWEQQLAASVATASRGSMDGATLAAEESAETGGDPRRSGGSGSKRRRRCKNWGCSKSKSRRSTKSEDDADDSLFGWEDAFMSTWGKDERVDITLGKQQSRREELMPGSAEMSCENVARGSDDSTVSCLEKLLTGEVATNVSKSETKSSNDNLDVLVDSCSGATATGHRDQTTKGSQPGDDCGADGVVPASTLVDSSVAVKSELSDEHLHPVIEALDEAAPSVSSTDNVMSTAGDEVQNSIVTSISSDPPALILHAPDNDTTKALSPAQAAVVVPVKSLDDYEVSGEEKAAVVVVSSIGGEEEPGEEVDEVDDVVANDAAESGGKVAPKKVVRKRRVKRLTAAKRKRS